MAEKRKPDQADAEQSNTLKDPDNWTTGDEKMTGAQRSYLKTLSEEAGVPMEENLTKAEASKRIDELRRKTGRGATAQPSAQPDVEGDNTIKNPDDWTTGDEKMTGAQRSYLKTLSEEAGVPMEENLTKAEASKRIDELRRKTGRGAEAEGDSSG